MCGSRRHETLPRGIVDEHHGADVARHPGPTQQRRRHTSDDGAACSCGVQPGDERAERFDQRRELRPITHEGHGAGAPIDGGLGRQQRGGVAQRLLEDGHQQIVLTDESRVEGCRSSRDENPMVIPVNAPSTPAHAAVAITAGMADTAPSASSSGMGPKVIACPGVAPG
jgi:hypothetical protein